MPPRITPAHRPRRHPVEPPSGLAGVRGGRGPPRLRLSAAVHEGGADASRGAGCRRAPGRAAAGRRHARCSTRRSPRPVRSGAARSSHRPSRAPPATRSSRRAGFRRVLTLTYARLELADADLGHIKRLVRTPASRLPLDQLDGRRAGRTRADLRRVAPCDGRHADGRHRLRDGGLGRRAGRGGRRGDREARRLAAHRGRGAHVERHDRRLLGAGPAGRRRATAGATGSTTVRPCCPSTGATALGLLDEGGGDPPRPPPGSPDLALLTDTAEDNAPMRQVNDALGYRPTHTAVEYQLDL